MMPLMPLDSATSTGLVKQIRTFTHIVSPPVIFATLGYAVALKQLPLIPGLLWGSVYGLLISALPIAFVVWLLRTGRIGDINMNRAERRLPYLVAVVCAALAALAIYAGGGPAYLYHLTLLNVIALSAMGLINTIWQISNHATAIVSAVWVAGIVFDRWAAVVLLPLCIGVCAARIYLRRHTPSQIVGGAVLGSAAVVMLLLTGCFGG